MVADVVVVCNVSNFFNIGDEGGGDQAVVESSSEVAPTVPVCVFGLVRVKVAVAVDELFII